MTMALCFNCGETKFGAWCPCKCGVSSSGNLELDIVFSDHHMSVASIEAFGRIIKKLATYPAEQEVRNWAFITYVSNHPAKILAADPPDELADQVADLLDRARLPIIDVEFKTPSEEDKGPPQRILEISTSVIRQYSRVHPFQIMARVQVRRDDGKIVDGTLIELEPDKVQLMIDESIEMLPNEITAIRPAPGCLLGWLFKPKWVEID